MSSAVIAVLAAVVGLHLLLTFSLIARVRTLQAMLQPELAALPMPGTAVTAFEAATPDGARLCADQLRDTTTLVGFFSPGCGPCEQMRGRLVETPPALPLVAFVAGAETDPAAQTLLASLATIGRAAYARAGDAAHQAFRPTAFPSLYRIENGQIAAAGHTLGDVLR